MPADAVFLPTYDRCYVCGQKPLRLGRTYIGTAWMTAGRGRRWEASGEIADEDGKVHARGHGAYFLLTERQTDDVAARMTYLPGDLPAFKRQEDSNG